MKLQVHSSLTRLSLAPSACPFLEPTPPYVSDLPYPYNGKIMLNKTHLALVFIAAFLPVASDAQIAQESVDLSVVQRIREEGLERSQVPELAQYLTEVIGPRLTGSPAMQRATEWAAGKYREWGLQSVEIEPWGEFGRGWERESYSGRVITPFVQPLHAEPVSWTGSTDGMQRGNALILRATNEEELEQYRGHHTRPLPVAD